MGFVTLIYGGMGLLTAALALPMMYDKVPPNRFYGFRTPRTLSDPSVWYPANRVAGRNLVVAGVIVCMTALVLYAIRNTITLRTASWALLTISVTALFGGVLHSFIALRRI